MLTGIPPVTKPTELIGIPPIAKPRTMLIGTIRKTEIFVSHGSMEDKEKPSEECIFHWQNLNSSRPLTDGSFPMKKYTFSTGAKESYSLYVGHNRPMKIIICGKKDRVTARATVVGPPCRHRRSGEVVAPPSLEWGGRGAANAHRSQQSSSLATALESGSASSTRSEGEEGGESPLILREIPCRPGGRRQHPPSLREPTVP
jgi:hypothetical protein